MTRKEIAVDPWKARDDVATKAQAITEKINNMWISEDGMAEDPEYRKFTIAKIFKAHRLVENLLNNL